jgi:hypothetical protein
MKPTRSDMVFGSPFRRLLPLAVIGDYEDTMSEVAEEVSDVIMEIVVNDMDEVEPLVAVEAQDTTEGKFVTPAALQKFWAYSVAAS